MSSRLGLVLVLALGFGQARTAFAQAASPEVTGADPTRDTKAQAIQFFDRAKALHDVQKFEEACPLFEESLRLDFGLGTLLWLSDCQEQIGRTASAWAGFTEAAELAANRGERDRAKIATERAAKLEPSLSYLKIELSAEHSALGTKLERNGVPISALTGLDALAVDPGDQEIVAKAPGYEPAKVTVHVGKGPAVIPVVIPPLKKAAEVVTPDRGAGIDGDAMRIAGVVVGASGLVGLGLGTGFGIDAIKTYDDALATCANGVPTQCTNEGVALQEDAQRSALVSTITFAVGGTLLAGGALLYFLAPSSSEDEEPAKVSFGLQGLSVGPSGAFLTMGGVL